MSPAQEFKEDHSSQRVPCKHHGALQIARGFSRGSNKKKMKTRWNKNTFKWKSSIIHSYTYSNQLLYCILPSKNSCFFLKINSKKMCPETRMCCVMCHFPRHAFPNERVASDRNLTSTHFLLPGGSDDVGRNVPKHCLLTWQQHPRSSVGVQGAYNTRHPLPKLQDRKTGASFVSGKSKELWRFGTRMAKNPTQQVSEICTWNSHLPINLINHQSHQPPHYLRLSDREVGDLSHLLHGRQGDSCQARIHRIGMDRLPPWGLPWKIGEGYEFSRLVRVVEQHSAPVIWTMKSWLINTEKSWSLPKASLAASCFSRQIPGMKRKNSLRNWSCRLLFVHAHDFLPWKLSSNYDSWLKKNTTYVRGWWRSHLKLL